MILIMHYNNSLHQAKLSITSVTDSGKIAMKLFGWDAATVSCNYESAKGGDCCDPKRIGPDTAEVSHGDYRDSISLPKPNFSGVRFPNLRWLKG